MKRLLTITALVAIGALTACNPLEPVIPTIDTPIQVDIAETPSESGECVGEGCPTLPTPEPDAPCSTEGGNICLGEGGVPIPTTTAVPPVANICAPGEVEGGLTC